MSNTAKYIAHRGLSMEAPENSMPAFELACRSDFWGIECDIYCTEDNQWFVFHDDTVDRMTNNTGKTMDFTYAEISKLTINAGNNIENFPRLTIPTLQELLALCKAYEKYLFIEIKNYLKDEQLPLLMDLIDQAEMKDYCRIICFDSDVLRKIRQLDRDMPLGFLSSRRPSEADMMLVDKLAPAFLDYHFAETAYGDIQRCRKAGIEVALWTINDRDTARFFVKAGADYITTDAAIY